MRKYIELNIPFSVKPLVMLKCFRFTLFLSFFSIVSFGQSTLMIEGATPKLFLNHKVSAKENFYSVGRKYNIPPKDLAAYNNLQFEKGLNVGETIKIPLTENNFSQNEASVAGKNLLPVYHTVLPKEGLYRVSISYNKVPLTLVKKWNHLQSDNVSIGTPLIIGFLKTDKTESLPDGRLAKPGTQIIQVSPIDNNNTPPTTIIEKHEKTSPEKESDVDKAIKKDAAISQTEEPKTTSSPVNTKSNINFSGGYFKKLYDDQATAKTTINDGGNASVFKSTSGWQDGKYYCFNNDAPPGSVIKVTSSLTNKSVYAKVLDAIPDIKQNEGITIIVSNAAAEELGAGDKFVCVLSYVK